MLTNNNLLHLHTILTSLGMLPGDREAANENLGEKVVKSRLLTNPILSSYIIKG